eukprot:g2476.t1
MSGESLTTTSTAGASNESGPVQDVSGKAKAPVTESVLASLRQVIEPLFTRKNLASDSALVAKMNVNMFLPIKYLAGLAAVSKISSEETVIEQAMRSSSVCTVSEDGFLIKPNLRMEERNTIVLRNISPDTPKEEVKKLFDAPECGSVLALRGEVGNNWFVTMESEEQAMSSLMFLLSGKTFNGKSIKGGLKSESLARTAGVSITETLGSSSKPSSPNSGASPPNGNRAMWPGTGANMKGVPVHGYVPYTPAVPMGFIGNGAGAAPYQPGIIMVPGMYLSGGRYVMPGAAGPLKNAGRHNAYRGNGGSSGGRVNTAQSAGNGAYRQQAGSRGNGSAGRRKGKFDSQSGGDAVAGRRGAANAPKAGRGEPAQGDSIDGVYGTGQKQLGGGTNQKKGTSGQPRYATKASGKKSFQDSNGAGRQPKTAKARAKSINLSSEEAFPSLGPEGTPAPPVSKPFKGWASLMKKPNAATTLSAETPKSGNEVSEEPRSIRGGAGK